MIALEINEQRYTAETPRQAMLFAARTLDFFPRDSPAYTHLCARTSEDMPAEELLDAIREAMGVFVPDIENPRIAFIDLDGKEQDAE